jgi:hypothetical protein
MTQVSTHVLLAKVLAKATREFHRPGVLIEDTTSEVLVRCGCNTPIADENASRISTTVGSRRSRPHQDVMHRAGTITVLPVDDNSQAPSEPSRALVAWAKAYTIQTTVIALLPRIGAIFDTIGAWRVSNAWSEYVQEKAHRW